VEVAGQAKKWEEKVAEEEGHLLQAVVVLASQHLVEEVEEQEERSCRPVQEFEVEEVAAFLQLQHSRPGKKNPSEEAVEVHPNVQAEEEVPKRYACLRPTSSSRGVFGGRGGGGGPGVAELVARLLEGKGKLGVD
jgi:hypothetical protein